MPMTLPRPAAPSRPRGRRGASRLSWRRPVLAVGVSDQGDAWSLTVQRTSFGLRTQLEIRSAGTTLRPASADATLGLAPGQAMRVASGSEASGPAWMVLRLHHGVDGVQVRLSDGTVHDLDILTDPDRLPAGVAVLLYPRHLDVHRIDLYDVHGRAVDTSR